MPPFVKVCKKCEEKLDADDWCLRAVTLFEEGDSKKAIFYAQKAVELARNKGIKVGLLRPITLFPFPKQPLFELVDQVKGILSVELSTGQMIEDVKLAVECKVPVAHFGRTGGIIHTPEEILEALEQKIIKNGSN